jgi:putative glutamine amidotransferase
MNIGITAGISKSQYFINYVYVQYVTNSGFNPVLITPDNDPHAMTAICDGLLLPGGIDIEPTFYGEDNLDSRSVDPVKDDFERKIFHAFIAEEKPVFGICRGFQLMVREFLKEVTTNDVTFYQHINEHALASSRGIPRNIPSHNINANATKMYGEGAEFQHMFVNSMHHQALLSKEARPTVINNNNIMQGIADTTFGLKTKSKEYIVEAVDITFNNTILRGVQWHPEELNDTALLEYFFNNATKQKPLGEKVGVFL